LAVADVGACGGWFNGGLNFDGDKPDGTPVKMLDVSRLTALGWQAKMPLEAGIKDTYVWYVSHR
ncbi:MAG: hypothetical protein J7M20_06950, partial [Deltaproteobacteria bacterium]|nr:hypothetical protein [Deltaproteobacteria bacterium]